MSTIICKAYAYHATCPTYAGREIEKFGSIEIHSCVKHCKKT